MLYFDKLSENVIDNIVRFLSCSQRAEKRTQCIGLEEISKLYEVRGELGTFLHTHFTSLRLHNEIGNRVGTHLEGEQKDTFGCMPEALPSLSLPDVDYLSEIKVIEKS